MGLSERVLADLHKGLVGVAELFPAYLHHSFPREGDVRQGIPKRRKELDQHQSDQQGELEDVFHVDKAEDEDEEEARQEYDGGDLPGLVEHVGQLPMRPNKEERAQVAAGGGGRGTRTSVTRAPTSVGQVPPSSPPPPPPWKRAPSSPTPSGVRAARRPGRKRGTSR